MSRTFAALRLLPVVLLLSTLPAPAAAQTRQLLNYEQIHKPLVADGGAMVVSQSTQASEAGAQVLREGGNAVDAAVTMAFVMAVTLPRAGNIGGDGYMLIHLADGQRAVAIDYRSMAPALAVVWVTPQSEKLVRPARRRRLACVESVMSAR